MRCPELIGRAAEVEQVRSRIAGLTDRAGGGVVVVVGDAGAGKTRLLRDATEGLEVTTLAGRCVPGDSPVPYRPLAEAVLAGLRGRPVPDDPTLAGFEEHLGRLVPAWRSSATADDAPILVAEALVRLLVVLAEGRPSVLLLEDLHWGDPETLAVVEYLADALADQPVLCVATTRPADPAGVVDRLTRRDPSGRLDLVALDEDQVAAMVAACLAAPEPPAGLAGFVHEHSDGNPFLVEELLTGLVAAGALQEVGGRWEVTGPLTPSVPASLRDSIRRRLATLDPTARRVLAAAALLGRQFDWELLPGIAKVDGRTAVDALRVAVDEQLLDADGDGFSFRHALTREAVLADALPPERRELASSAWPAIERANPGLPGASCQLAADLAEAAGDRTAAAERLVVCARRALDGGALATAEATARRAGALATGADGAGVALDADEVLVDVLAAAGKSEASLALGRDLADRMAAAGAATGRRADLLVTLARAAVAAGDLGPAHAAACDAREVAGDDADDALLARVDAVAAEVALDRAELDDAAALATAAVERARLTGQPEVECAALIVLGRVQRPAGLERSQATFAEAEAVAARAGLARWHLRARHELALDTRDRGVSAMRETRELAARYGAHLTVAVMDLVLADVALTNFDAAGCLQAARACADASHRYRLATEPVAHLWVAGGHALAGDDDAMQVAIDAALERDPDDPRILGDLDGRVLATRAFVRDELETLPEILDRMMEHVRRAPATTSVYPGRMWWALVHTIDDDDGGTAARRAYHDATDHLELPGFTLTGEVIDVIALGRAGDRARATERMVPLYDQMVQVSHGLGIVRASLVLVARAAIRDGWGEPVRWLRETEAWFADRGLERLVRRCRQLQVEAGAPVSRRGRGDSEVPASLRAMGVTSREVDVLRLVVEGRTNREIAESLYLSPKTVERHLSSLFDRTGVRNRRDLAEVGTTHLPPGPDLGTA